MTGCADRDLLAPGVLNDRHPFTATALPESGSSGNRPYRASGTASSESGVTATKRDVEFGVGVPNNFS